MSFLETDKKQLSELKDPFASEHIKSVWFCIDKDYHGEMEYSAWVEFKNGNTEGKQHFEAESFQQLVRKVDEFTRSL